MYVIITMSLTATARGLHETCVNYCKHLPNQLKSTRHDCNCTDAEQQIIYHSTTPVDTSSSEIDYESTKLLSSPTPQDAQKMSHFINSKIKTKEHNMSTEMERTGIQGENNISTLQKYKRNHENLSNHTNNIIEFPLYLDIDLQAQPSGRWPSLKIDLKNIFDRIRASERDISKCVNLHIYIFSKNIDNINTTQTNWGHYFHRDNLSNSEVLTEIQNKCEQPVTIIHESIYEIRQRNHGLDVPQDNHTTTINNATYSRENQPLSHNLPKALKYSDLYQVTSDIIYNELQQTPTSMNVVEKAKFNKNAIEKHTLYAASTHHQTSNEDGQLSTSELKTILMSRKSLGISRKGYGEQDMLISKIVTKELANNTVMSVVDGYEVMPNLNFVDNVINRDGNGNTHSSEEDIVKISTPTDLTNVQYIGNRNESGIIQDNKGDLYFLFGNDQVPARFIQNAEGEMHLAVDGFRLCDQVIEYQENKLAFMNLLCNCIKFHICH